MRRDAATEAQVRAADPACSTWLGANAGSGKTRVLTDRVARLLLQGVSPQHILCLTFTTAAATEMQNRLFKRLGGWAMLEPDALRGELERLGIETALEDGFLETARTLFARAIETPGGLRIQTIHSFCAGLLRRFPLEAGVSPQFTEMEERAAERLRAEVLGDMADGPQSGLFRDLAAYLTEERTDAFLRDLCTFRDALLRTGDARSIRESYGLRNGDDEESLLAQVFFGDEMSVLAEMVPALETGSSNDKTLAQALKSLGGPDMAALRRLEAALLVGSGDNAGRVSSKLITKKLREGILAGVADRFDALAQRVAEARQTRIALEAARRDDALHAFAAAFLPAYDAAKQRRGWLDFDDLIRHARDLLWEPSVADWVLYRLDGGIDHILVDEAQDTAPIQWQVIERLAQELSAGDGADRDVPRTLFVVGDKKQSIYAFQGADPAEFDRMRDTFAERLRGARAPLVPLTLEYSFRSAEPILRLVDHSFSDAAASGFGGDQKHRAFRQDMPGRVDLWPWVEASAEEPDGDWSDPVDRVGSQHHSVVLARRVARFIRETVDAGTPLPKASDPSGGSAARPVKAGDFLILVRSRSPLFTEIIRACKQEDLPIAGADRLKVMAELAVRDIVALLRFLETQEDDLSLATCLRSPLFAWSEQSLFDLAHRRGEAYLWEALRTRSGEFAETHAMLSDLLGRTDFLRPFDLIDRILTRHDGRRRLIGRLGAEAEDGINALLSQALAYERTDIPSLTGFLEWVRTDNLEIKRSADSAGARLRVMTVHGAKGLEAPIVILPDCASGAKPFTETLVGDDDGLFWKAASGAMPERQQSAVEEAKRAARREEDRLLYVAMTRAENWLIVAAAGGRKSGGGTWYDRVESGMQASGAITRAFRFGADDGGPGLSLGHQDWSDLPVTRPEETRPVAEPMPGWFQSPAPPPRPEPAVVSPSDLGGAKALAGAAGDTEDRAKARGTALHSLLEWLAPLETAARPGVRTASLARLRPGWSPEEEEALWEEAQAVLSAPDLAAVFAPDALAEVPVTADLPGIGRIHGVVDRLIVTPERVLAVDFKSNRTVPETAQAVPEGILRQMGAYAAALSLIYPGRPVDTALVWTAERRLMALPRDLVARALSRAAVT